MNNKFEQLTEKWMLESKDTIALRNLCEEYCGRFGTAVYNALMRGEIRSIKTLYETDLETLFNIRNIGVRRIGYIKTLKQVIKDELDKLD